MLRLAPFGDIAQEVKELVASLSRAEQAQVLCFDEFAVNEGKLRVGHNVELGFSTIGRSTSARVQRVEALAPVLFCHCFGWDRGNTHAWSGNHHW